MIDSRQLVEPIRDQSSGAGGRDQRAKTQRLAVIGQAALKVRYQHDTEDD